MGLPGPMTPLLTVFFSFLKEFKTILHEKEQEIVRLVELLQTQKVAPFLSDQLPHTCMHLRLPASQDLVARAAALEDENVWLQAAVLEREKEAGHLRRTLSAIATTATRAAQSSQTPLAADSLTQPVRNDSVNKSVFFFYLICFS